MTHSCAAPAGDRHISYLPLAHIYERIMAVTAIHCGCSIGFYRGDVLQLLDDVAELQPTIFLSVPRLYNRIYDKASPPLLLVLSPCSACTVWLPTVFAGIHTSCRTLSLPHIGSIPVEANLANV